jgi:hypothetical protein
MLTLVLLGVTILVLVPVLGRRLASNPKRGSDAGDGGAGDGGGWSGGGDSAGGGDCGGDGGSDGGGCD